MLWKPLWHILKNWHLGNVYLLYVNKIFCSLFNNCKRHMRSISPLIALRNFLSSMTQPFQVLFFFLIILFCFCIRHLISVFPFNPCHKEVLSHHYIADKSITTETGILPHKDLKEWNANAKIMKMKINGRDQETSPAL